MTVAELTKKLTSAELTEWLAYYHLESEERGGGAKSKKQTEKEMKDVLMGFGPKRK